MDRPSHSPDLNPIENLWPYLDAKVPKRPSPPKNAEELYDALVEEWKNLKPDYLKNLVHSMPKCCSEAIKQKGYWTKY